MTNITLSIDDKIYNKMKEFSEIRWSEFVRKIISKRINELESIKEDDGFLTILASEKALKGAWDNDLDERWNKI